VPSGTVLIGTTTPTRALQVLRWDDLAHAGDAGLVIDTNYDPRLGLIVDGGSPDGGTDGGTPDGGGGGGGGGGTGGGGNTPIGPGIPVNHGGGCATTPAEASTLAALLAALALLLSRGRQTR
jgi:MYXO-CTERM domain-containing protein